LVVGVVVLLLLLLELDDLLLLPHAATTRAIATATARIATLRDFGLRDEGDCARMVPP
jgi:hypothetical protein